MLQKTLNDARFVALFLLGLGATGWPAEAARAAEGTSCLWLVSTRGVGCASIGQAIAYQVGNGPPNGSGALNIGFQQLAIPLFGGYVLTEPSVPIGHNLDALGTWQVTLNTPPDPALVGIHIFFQAVYIDAGAPFFVTASDGLDMLIL